MFKSKSYPWYLYTIGALCVCVVLNRFAYSFLKLVKKADSTQAKETTPYSI